jgi:hypothetical protein
MNYQTLLGQLENHMEDNDRFFKKIHNVLYFNDETFLHNPDFLNDNNNKEKTYTIEIRNLGGKNNDNHIIQKNEHKKFTLFIKNYFNIQKYNFSQDYTSITDCILNIIDYKMANGKSQLFKKMLRENDSINFFNKFNFQKRKICKKKVLRDLLIKQDEDNEIIIKFLCDYLNINLLILENNKYSLYSNNDEFELYKVTLVLYKYDGKYQYLIEKETNKQLFTSDDEINYKIKFNLFIKNNDFNIPINNQFDDLNDLTNNIERLNLEPEIIEEIIDIIPVVEEEEEYTCGSCERIVGTDCLFGECQKCNLIMCDNCEGVIDEDDGETYCNNCHIEEIIEPVEEINYKKMKVVDLKKLCKKRKIKGYSKLKKQQLIDILQ